MTFKQELESKCKNILEYSGRDIIECEINNMSQNGFLFDHIPQGFIKGGKQTIDIMGDAISKILPLIATDEDVQELQLIDMQIGKKRINYLKNLEAEMNRQDGTSKQISETDVQDKMTIWSFSNNKYKEFREKMGYEIAPIRHFKMIVNKGPAATDLISKDSRDKDLYTQVLEQNKMMTKLIEALTQKK